MTENDDKPDIRTERRGQSLWIWIDREERRNAINKRVISGIEKAVTEAQQDPVLRGIVLTGAGRKAFCAGADLGGGTETFTLGLDEPMTDFGKLARVVRNIGIPIIGRINGDCVAGGMGLMSLCDLVVVADHARFGLPEAKVGVFPMQVLVFLRGMIGARHINELCLTGELISATRAREIGIANYVVPFEELDARVDALMSKIGEMSPVALRRGKYAIAAMESMAFAEAMAFAETMISVTSLTNDAAEGIAAFNERRPPKWRQKVNDA
jgi:enoyl-CoA hydratase/carnithine racemase